jgi:hypothetical protein
MSAFTVELDNQPDELARLCDAMARSGPCAVRSPISHAQQHAATPRMRLKAQGRRLGPVRGRS